MIWNKIIDTCKHVKLFEANQDYQFKCISPCVLYHVGNTSTYLKHDNDKVKHSVNNVECIAIVDQSLSTAQLWRILFVADATRFKFWTAWYRQIFALRQGRPIIHMIIPTALQLQRKFKQLFYRLFDTIQKLLHCTVKNPMVHNAQDPFCTSWMFGLVEVSYLPSIPRTRLSGKLPYQFRIRSARPPISRTRKKSRFSLFLMSFSFMIYEHLLPPKRACFAITHNNSPDMKLWEGCCHKLLQKWDIPIFP